MPTATAAADDRSWRRHSHRPAAPDHVVHGRLGKLTLVLRVSWATASERVVAVPLQRPSLRRVFVPTSVLGSDGGVVGDAHGTRAAHRRQLAGHHRGHPTGQAGTRGRLRGVPGRHQRRGQGLPRLSRRGDLPPRSKRRVPDRLPLRFGRPSALLAGLPRARSVAGTRRAPRRRAIQTQVLTGLESGSPCRSSRATRWPS